MNQLQIFGDIVVMVLSVELVLGQLVLIVIILHFLIFISSILRILVVYVLVLLVFILIAAIIIVSLVVPTAWNALIHPLPAQNAPSIPIPPHQLFTTSIQYSIPVFCNVLLHTIPTLLPNAVHLVSNLAILVPMIMYVRHV